MHVKPFPLFFSVHGGSSLFFFQFCDVAEVTIIHKII